MKATPPPAQESRALHRIRDVRLAEGVSLEAVARRMNERPSLLKKEECCDADLRLSDLYRWQSALGVPLIDLLAEPDYGLSEIVRSALIDAHCENSQFHFATIHHTGRATSAQTLVDQLVDTMPELEEIGAGTNAVCRNPRMRWDGSLISLLITSGGRSKRITKRECQFFVPLRLDR